MSSVRDEIAAQGWLTTFSPPKLDKKTMLQYERDDPMLQGGRRRFGAYNTITVYNQSAADIKLRPDFADSRTIYCPAGSVITMDEIVYQEFSVENVSDTDNADAGSIVIIFGYQAPVTRERARKLSGARS